MAQTITVNLQEPASYVQNTDTAELTQARLLIWFDSIVRQIDQRSDEAVEFTVQGSNEDANRLVGTILADLPSVARENRNSRDVSEASGSDFMDSVHSFASAKKIGDQISTVIALLAFHPANHINFKTMSLLKDVDDLSIIGKVLEVKPLAGLAQSFLSCVDPDDKALFSKLVDSVVPVLKNPEASADAQLALARMGGGRVDAIDLIINKLLAAIPDSNKPRSIDDLIPEWAGISGALATIATVHELDRSRIEDKLEAKLVTSNAQDETIVLARALALINTTRPDYALEAIDKLVQAPPHSIAKPFIEEIRDQLQTRSTEVKSTITAEDRQINQFIEMLGNHDLQNDARKNLVNFSSIRGRGIQSVLISRLSSTAKDTSPEAHDLLNGIADTLRDIVSAQPAEDEYMHTTAITAGKDHALTPAKRTTDYILSHLKSPIENAALDYVRQKFEATLSV